MDRALKWFQLISGPQFLRKASLISLLLMLFQHHKDANQRPSSKSCVEYEMPITRETDGDQQNSTDQKYIIFCKAHGPKNTSRQWGRFESDAVTLLSQCAHLKASQKKMEISLITAGKQLYFLVILTHLLKVLQFNYVKYYFKNNCRASKHHMKLSSNPINIRWGFLVWNTSGLNRPSMRNSLFSQPMLPHKK